MSETIQLVLSAELASRARSVADSTNRRLEDVVAEWVGRGAAEPAIEGTSDDDLLALCDAMLPDAKQQEISDLLARNRESLLDLHQRRRLDELMASYRQCLLLKAKAWQQAVLRGLRPPLKKAQEEIQALEERLRALQQVHPVGSKGFTKAGVRKLIARLHEELALYEASEDARRSDAN